MVDASFVPRSIERSPATASEAATLALALLMWQWRPLPAVVWQVNDGNVAGLFLAMEALGWLTVLTSTFLINHFELFGLHQVANNLIGKQMPPLRFRTPLLYNFVRHPIYLGLTPCILGSADYDGGAPALCGGHYSIHFVGIALEEQDLIALFGDEYRRYRERVGMILPRVLSRRSRAITPAE